MNASIFRQMVFERRRSILWWTVGIGILVLIVAASYPSIRDAGELFDEYMEQLPPSLQEAFGLSEELSITSAPGYITSQLHSNMYPILLLVLGFSAAAWSIAGSESDGTLETTLANPITRVELAVSRFTATAMIVAIVTAATTAVLALIAPVFGLNNQIPWWGMWAAGLATYAFVMFHVAVTFAVGAVTGRKGIAIAAGAGLAALGFVGQTLAGLSERLEFMRTASPWYWLLRENPLVNNPTLLSTGLPLILMLVAVAIGVFWFDRRDIHGA